MVNMDDISLCKANIAKEEYDAIKDVLDSGWLTHGPKTIEFEEMFANYIGVKHAIAMNSCTSALFLALLANDITGDVLVPSFTFVASANAIVTAGANPVFVDINYSDCNINPEELEKYLTPNTQAIMVVHFAGQVCEMDKISEFALRHKLVLIEDSAETIGGTLNGRKSGNWGIGCFSFFPTKNITTGEGGMLSTDNDEFAEKIRTLIGHGIRKTTIHREKSAVWHREASIPGYNFRLSNINAAIGVEQMKKLDYFNQQRNEHSSYLIDKLKNVEEIELPIPNENKYHVYQMFTIKVQKNRDRLVHGLRNKGIGASVHFDPPVHLQSAYLKYNVNSLPVTEKVSKEILTLPMFPQLTKQQLDRIINSLLKCLNHV